MMRKQITSSIAYKLFRLWWLLFARSKNESKKITRKKAVKGAHLLCVTFEIGMSLKWILWDGFAYCLTRIWSMLWCKFYWVVNAKDIQSILIWLSVLFFFSLSFYSLLYAWQSSSDAEITVELKRWRWNWTPCGKEILVFFRTFSFGLHSIEAASSKTNIVYLPSLLRLILLALRMPCEAFSVYFTVF